MAIPERKRRVDAIQKFLMYLILLNLALVASYGMSQSHLVGAWALSVPVMLVLFNVMLCNITIKRGRRRRDSYLLYPVAVSSICLGFFVLQAIFV